MCGRNIFHVDDADAVGGGIVLRRQEMRIARDLDAARLQEFPDGGLVRHRGDDPGIGQALISAAGPAVERRLVRVVLGRAAVRAEENHAGEIGGQSHQPQRGLHEISLLGHGEPGLRETFEPIRNPARADPMALAQFLIECFFGLRSAGQRVRRLAADPVRWPIAFFRIFSKSAGESAAPARPNRSRPSSRMSACCSAAIISSASSGVILSTVKVVATDGIKSCFNHRLAVVVPTGQQRLAQQGQAEEPAEGLHHDIGRDHVFLQVVQERVRGLTELGRCLVSLGEDTVIATGYFANLVLWFQEDRAMGDRMVRAEGLIVQRHAEKPGESQRFIPAAMLEMPAKDFRADVDAKYDLSERPRLRLLIA